MSNGLKNGIKLRIVFEAKDKHDLLDGVGILLPTHHRLSLNASVLADSFIDVSTMSHMCVLETG